MDFDFNIKLCLKERLTLVHKVTERRRIEMIDRILNELGIASARAQGLRTPITTAQKVRTSGQHVYLLADLTNNKVLGFVKVGHKKLFLHDWSAGLREVTPMCLLDFYVHESCQRSGYGLELINAVTQYERVFPQELAIDRPSAKCISFFAKRFSLRDYQQQSNNYLVFRQFFEKTPNHPTIEEHLEQFASRHPDSRESQSTSTTPASLNVGSLSRSVEGGSGKRLHEELETARYTSRRPGPDSTSQSPKKAHSTPSRSGTTRSTPGKRIPPSPVSLSGPPSSINRHSSIHKAVVTTTTGRMLSKKPVLPSIPSPSQSRKEQNSSSDSNTPHNKTFSPSHSLYPKTQTSSRTLSSPQQQQQSIKQPPPSTYSDLLVRNKLETSNHLDASFSRDLKQNNDHRPGRRQIPVSRRPVFWMG